MILYAVGGGSDRRLRSSPVPRAASAGGLFYGLFVLAASLHAPIGVRNVLREWTPWRGRSLDTAMLILALALLATGCARRMGGGGMSRMPRQSRRHAGFAAFVAHRLSGDAVGPVSAAAFPGPGAGPGRRSGPWMSFLAFSDLPWVKAAEWTLVVLLSACT